MSLSDLFSDWLEKIEPICKDCVFEKKILFLFFSFKNSQDRLNLIISGYS